MAEKSWPERELLRALEQLRASAAESLASPRLIPNDAPLIRGALADLDAYADSLLAVLRSIDDGVFDLLRPVLVAAVIIGSRRPPPFASLKDWQELKEIQAKYIALAGRSKKAAERAVKLIEAIKAEAALRKRPLAISLKYAGLILPGVRRRLNLNPKGKGWPSESTIKGAIRQIKSVKT